MFDFKNDAFKILAALHDGVALVENLAPLATAIGGPIVGNVADTVASIAGIVTNVATRSMEAGEVFSNEDQAAISVIVARLAAVNDKLAEAIAKS